MVNSEAKTLDLPKIEEPMDKLKEILLGLKQGLCDLHQKIEMIDSNTELQSSIKNYKKNAEKRADKLEVEVKWLREELKAIGDLSGFKVAER